MDNTAGHKEIKLYTCLRCDHKWANRKARTPKVCPRCKSYDWDIPKGTR